MKMSRRWNLSEFQRRGSFNVTISCGPKWRRERIPPSKSTPFVCFHVEWLHKLMTYFIICLLIMNWLSAEHVECKLASNRAHSKTIRDQLDGLIYGEGDYDLIPLRESARAYRRAIQASKKEHIESNKLKPSRQEPLRRAPSHDSLIAKQRQIHTSDATKFEAGTNLLAAYPRTESSKIRAKATTRSIRSAIVPQELKAVPRLQSASLRKSQEVSDRQKIGINKKSESDNVEEDDGELGDQEEEETEKQNEKPASSTRQDHLDGRASITSKATADNLAVRSRSFGRQSLPVTENRDEQETGPSGGNSNEPNSQDEEPGITPEAEAAERRELEAAEASEADEANRSALAEQQQQQREIIMAQAESEAKAIREQQNALLKQQQLQQQMLLRRHQSLIEDNANMSQRKTKTDKGLEQLNRKREFKSAAEGKEGKNQLRGQVRSHQRASPRSDQIQDGRRQRQQPSNEAVEGSRKTNPNRLNDYGDPPTANVNHADNPSSDQQDDEPVERGASATREVQVEKHSRSTGNHQATPKSVSSHYQANHRTGIEPQDQELELAETSNIDRLALGDRMNSTNPSDLVAAAQHHNYGAHYGSLDAHHGQMGIHNSGGGHHNGGKYYQFAESHKKGQYKSGFKRGNKKFVISGHSSQHKDHAQGHVKWHGKKGKGSHKWDYQHSNKKHYGSGNNYGGGHYHY